MASEFDQSMKDLLEISRKIIDFNTIDNSFATKKEKKKITKNPILKCLEKYSADYNLSEEEGNKDDVLVTYKKIKAALLKGWKYDDWLKSTNVTIYSGALEPDDKRKIMLSAIYVLACRHRDQCRDSLKGLPVEAFDGREELLFPAKFQLYMYRVFRYALNDETYSDDITKITTIISDLEKELKVPPLTIKKEGGTIEASKPENPLVDGLFGLAKDLISKMGVQLPEGAQLPMNGSNIMEAAVSIFNRPETKDFLLDIGETMKGAHDLGDAFQKIVSKFQDPNSVEKLKKMATSVLPTEMVSSNTTNSILASESKQEE